MFRGPGEGDLPTVGLQTPKTFRRVLKFNRPTRAADKFLSPPTTKPLYGTMGFEFTT